jgi:hypothetical protein
LVLSYQGLEEENLDQKSPSPPGLGLMQRASSSLITKKHKTLKNQTPSLGMVFGFRKTATAVVGPEIEEDILPTH